MVLNVGGFRYFNGRGGHRTCLGIAWTPPQPFRRNNRGGPSHRIPCARPPQSPILSSHERWRDASPRLRWGAPRSGPRVEGGNPLEQDSLGAVRTETGATLGLGYAPCESRVRAIGERKKGLRLFVDRRQRHPVQRAQGRLERNRGTN